MLLVLSATMNDQMFAANDCWDVENPCGVCRWCHPDYCGHCDRVGCNEIGGHPPPSPPSVLPEEEGVQVDSVCMWCETAPCAKETKATAIVEDFLVRGVSGLVAGYIGSEGAECWSCTGYAFCHCAAPSRHNV